MLPNLAVLMVFLLLASGASADWRTDLDKANNALDRRAYQDAIDYLTNAIRSGEVPEYRLPEIFEKRAAVHSIIGNDILAEKDLETASRFRGSDAPVYDSPQYSGGTTPQIGESSSAQSRQRESELRACNNSYQKVYVARASHAGKQDGSGEEMWESEGWWHVEHGDCLALFTGPFDKRYYFLYAESDGGTWGGDFCFCTLQDKFNIIDTQCEEGFKRHCFRRLDMDDHPDGLDWNLNP